MKFFSFLTPVYILSVYFSPAHAELVQGFPEGCAFATMNQTLPYHILGYGRINWMGAGWAFQYLDQNVPGPFSIAAVADNLGLMGQNPEQNISMELLALTPGDKYVVAQILDRSEMGLGPIVTCISPAFFGSVVPNRAIVFGQDYWREYRRFRDYRWDDSRRRRWERWKYRWNDRVVDWRRKWKEKEKRDLDGDRGRDIRRPKPGLIMPIKGDDTRDHERDRNRDRPRDIRAPKPGLIMPVRERDNTGKPLSRDRDWGRQKPEKIHIKLPEDADSKKIQQTVRIKPNIQNNDDDQQEERKEERKEERRIGRRKR